MQYSIQPRDWVFVKNHKFLDYAKQSATDPIKTASNRSIQKTAEARDALIGDKNADKIT